MKSPAFQFYVNDWLSSRNVRLMDAEQRGWYIQLLAEAWMSVPQCSLPNDKELLWKLAGASDQRSFESRCGPVLSNFNERSNMLFNERLEREMKKQKEFSKQRSNAGKISAQKRNRTLTSVEISLNDNPTNQPTGSQRESNSSITSSSSITYTKEKVFSKKRELTDLWCSEFQKIFNLPYQFKGAQDGKAADSLLGINKPNEEIISSAKKAWSQVNNPKSFWSKKAVTLSGFASNYIQICGELGVLKPSNAGGAILQKSYQDLKSEGLVK